MLAIIGWLPVGAMLVLVTMVVTGPTASLPLILAVTSPVHVGGVGFLFAAPGRAWAAAIGLSGAAAGLVIAVGLLAPLGMATTPDAGAPLVVAAAVAGWLLAVMAAAGGRFGGPPLGPRETPGPRRAAD